MGNVLMVQGDFEKALNWLNKAAERDPDNPICHYNLGSALRGLGENSRAVTEYRRAIELNPRQAVFFHQLGEVLIELYELDDAVDCFNQALAIDPENLVAMPGLGEAWNALGDLDQAVFFYRKAISIDPANAKCYTQLGIAFEDHGEIDQAISTLREAIEINPALVSAYPVLARCKQFSRHDADMKAMESLFSRKGLNDKERSQLGFSLGKAYEDLGEYEKSIKFVLKAAGLKRKNVDFSIAETRARFERIKEVFSADFFQRFSGVGDSDQTPIFILGMPRSGTSLVEQILASHPAVFGAGELEALSLVYKSMAKSIDGSQLDSFPDALAGLDPDAFVRLGANYIRRIRRLSTAATYITDKLPHNFMRVGFIRAILPRARIIHCTRDPMDNCFSIFKTDFNKGHLYSYDMAELGQYYNLYRELMDYWKTTLPGFIYDQSYEELVSRQEEQTRGLLQHCGIPWDDACLDFHTTRRKLRTASNAQVVRPVYQGSVNLWTRYEKHLGPLVAAING